MKEEDRDYPTPVTGWVTRKGTKIYRSAAQSYYAIAKELVLEKYPAWLTSTTEGEGLEYPLATEERWCAAEFRAVRLDKAIRLFMVDGLETLYFNTDRFRKFVQRVAKWLRFFDRKRLEREPHRRFDQFTTHTLENFVDAAEKNADFWIHYLDKLKAEVARRAAGECHHPRRYTGGQCRNCGAKT